MDKIPFITLWDNYRGLLTPTQLEITDMYFNLDLTVSEIAEEKGISRQAVSECLKGCKKQLEEYEEKLSFCKRTEKEKALLKEKISAWAEEVSEKNPQFIGEIEKLLQTLSGNL